MFGTGGPNLVTTVRRILHVERRWRHQLLLAGLGGRMVVLRALLYGLRVEDVGEGERAEAALDLILRLAAALCTIDLLINKIGGDAAPAQCTFNQLFDVHIFLLLSLHVLRCHHVAHRRERLHFLVDCEGSFGLGKFSFQLFHADFVVHVLFSEVLERLLHVAALLLPLASVQARCFPIFDQSVLGGWQVLAHGNELLFGDPLYIYSELAHLDNVALLDLLGIVAVA